MGVMRKSFGCSITPVNSSLSFVTKKHVETTTNKNLMMNTQSTTTTTMMNGRSLKYIFDPSLAGVARHFMMFNLDYVFDKTCTDRYIMYLARQQDRVIITRSTKLVARLKQEKERNANTRIKLDKLKQKLYNYKQSCEIVDEDTVEIIQDEIDVLEEDVTNEYEYQYYQVKSLGRREQLEEVLNAFSIKVKRDDSRPLTCLHCGSTELKVYEYSVICDECGSEMHGTHMFKHKIIRHLYWILASPTLLSSSMQLVSDDDCSQYLQDSIQWLKQLDSNPSDINQFVLKKHGSGSTRLGNYFASLLEYFVAKRLSAPDSPVYRDIQVRESSHRTIGDMDIVFCDAKDDRWAHWEVGIKFYLFVDDPSIGKNTRSDQLNQFVGPMGSGDTLHKKLVKGLDHTLGLADLVRSNVDRYTFYPPIPTEHIPVKNYLFVKGIMFYPYGNWPRSRVQETFTSMNTNHLIGWWARFNPSSLNSNQFLVDQSSSGTRYKILEKDDYMGEYYQFGDESLLDAGQFFTSLGTYFAEKQRSLMVVEVKKQDTTNPGSAWVEVSRGFLVHAEWIARD